MIDPFIVVGGLFVGLVVGLTGMGGGALMTPLLVLRFGIEPLTAVSSDIVASMVMKPIGGAVHWRHGTVHRGLVGWLALGSVPSAFFGVWLIRRFDALQLQHHIKLSLGVALLVVCCGIVAKPLLMARRPVDDSSGPLVVKRVPTLLIGILGGLVVGLTSVGSGSLMIIMLLMLYPRLSLSQMVGTDLVQAVPLVTSAALGHMFFGSFKLGLTASILIGGIPGVFLGARFSSRASDHVIRPALVVVLLTTGLKLLGISNAVLAVVVPLAILIGIVTAVRRPRRALAVRPAPILAVVKPVPGAAESVEVSS